MLYCEKCRRLQDGGAARCSECKQKKLREPQPDDVVYLIAKEHLWAGMLADLLKNNGIPFLKEGLLGEGLNTYIGYGLESYSIFVPYQMYDKAKRLCDDIFTEITDEDIFIDENN